MTVFVPADPQMTMPTKGKATDAQLAENGRLCGRSYGEWHITREDKHLDAADDFLEFTGVYLGELNQKMIPVFGLSDEQLGVFNRAAMDGFTDYVAGYAKIASAVAGVIANGGSTGRSRP